MELLIDTFLQASFVLWCCIVIALFVVWLDKVSDRIAHDRKLKKEAMSRLSKQQLEDAINNNVTYY